MNAEHLERSEYCTDFSLSSWDLYPRQHVGIIYVSASVYTWVSLMAVCRKSMTKIYIVYTVCYDLKTVLETMCSTSSRHWAQSVIFSDTLSWFDSAVLNSVLYYRPHTSRATNSSTRWLTLPIYRHRDQAPGHSFAQIRSSSNGKDCGAQFNCAIEVTRIALRWRLV